jgi:glycosyltransferase involved in cell wall biosynthesis
LEALSDRTVVCIWIIVPRSLGNADTPIPKGEQRERLRLFVQKHDLKFVEVLGHRKRDEVFALMKGGQFLVFPSEWYECFPMTIAKPLPERLSNNM